MKDSVNKCIGRTTASLSKKVAMILLSQKLPRTSAFYSQLCEEDDVSCLTIRCNEGVKKGGIMTSEVSGCDSRA